MSNSGTFIKQAVTGTSTCDSDIKVYIDGTTISEKIYFPKPGQIYMIVDHEDIVKALIKSVGSKSLIYSIKEIGTSELFYNSKSCISIVDFQRKIVELWARRGKFLGIFPYEIRDEKK